MSRLEELMALAHKLADARVVRASCLGDHEMQRKLDGNIAKAFAALERALRDALEPQGWRLVPVETLDLVMAALKAKAGDGVGAANLRQRALSMLAAAPKEPTK